MERVRRLLPREVVRQDVDAIAEIYRNLGAPVAEQLVTRAFGELALSMASIAERVKRQDFRDLGRQFTRLQRLAEEIGLTSLAKVAADNAACLARDDATAFSAVWARLVRVAGASLSYEGDLIDVLT